MPPAWHSRLASGDPKGPDSVAALGYRAVICVRVSLLWGVTLCETCYSELAWPFYASLDGCPLSTLPPGSGRTQLVPPACHNDGDQWPSKGSRRHRWPQVSDYPEEPQCGSKAHDRRKRTVSTNNGRRARGSAPMGTSAQVIPVGAGYVKPSSCWLIFLFAAPLGCGRAGVEASGSRIGRGPDRVAAGGP